MKTAAKDVYDEVCAACRKPYLFRWAKQFGTRRWRDYCSPLCEDPERWRRLPPLLPEEKR